MSTTINLNKTNSSFYQSSRKHTFFRSHRCLFRLCHTNLLCVEVHYQCQLLRCGRAFCMPTRNLRFLLKDSYCHTSFQMIFVCGTQMIKQCSLLTSWHSICVFQIKNRRTLRTQYSSLSCSINPLDQFFAPLIGPVLSLLHSRKILIN